MHCPICNGPLILIGLRYSCVGCKYSEEPLAPKLIFLPDEDLDCQFLYSQNIEKLTDQELDWLRRNAEKTIPAGYYFEIWGQPPGRYGAGQCRVMWVYSPSFIQPYRPRFKGRQSPYVLLPNGYDSVIAGYISNCEYETVFGEKEGDCQCGHSWYDHIGWREGTNSRMQNCRIVRCDCTAYTHLL